MAKTSPKAGFVTKLPAIPSTVLTSLQEISDAIGVPRTVLPPDEEISYAWEQLPRLLAKIPRGSRTELHVRMCVAVANGLFDAAMNYAWNSSVTALRDKVRAFGLPVVEQINGTSFDEAALVGMTDADLLKQCLRLNLVDEEAFFFLGHCREIRNNFSAAHPTTGATDDQEFLVFLNRCAKYALSDTSNPTGVDVQTLIQSVKGPAFAEEQTVEWLRRLNATHEAQRQLIISMLHGFYCDPNSQQEARTNAITLCVRLKDQFSPSIISELINRHSDYIAKAKVPQQTASQEFFRHLGLFSVLSDQERHALVSNACARLLQVHHAWSNFHNEPPFAARLLELSSQGQLPNTVQREFVETVAISGTGNPYGLSQGADPIYKQMVRNFTPHQVGLFLDLSTSSVTLTRRLQNPRCQVQFRGLVGLLDPASVPVKARSVYDGWLTPAK